MIKRWDLLLRAMVLLIMMAPGTTAAEEEHEGHEGVHGHQHRLEIFLGNIPMMRMKMGSLLG